MKFEEWLPTILSSATLCRVQINNPSLDYKILWGCLICEKILLNENAATNKEKNCKPDQWPIWDNYSRG